MTNEHIITKEMIRKKAIITFYYNNGKIKKEIYLNYEHRFIQDFRYINIDATIVEILPQDYIDKDYFLLPSLDYIYDINKLKDKEIIIIQYPVGKLSYSSGKIIDIKENEIIHLATTYAGSSGSPIFLKDSIKVIGIHKASSRDNSENYADFIGPIIQYFYLNNPTQFELKNLNHYIQQQP